MNGPEEKSSRNELLCQISGNGVRLFFVWKMRWLRLFSPAVIELVQRKGREDEAEIY